MATLGRTHGGKTWVWGALLFLQGCTTARPPLEPLALPSLPRTHEVRAGQCVIISDQPLDSRHPLLRQIESLPDEICQELQLPSCRQFVMVYLFADRQQYEAYMNCQFPGLPNRRAYFMARTDSRRGEELCIFSFWGSHLEEDLRHELTHATLHSVLKNVPMWLDEGLAEYFELPREAKGAHRAHLAELSKDEELGNPAWPSLQHLEKLTEVHQMTAADYRASWSMVHWLLRGSPQGRQVLLKYLQRLRSDENPPPFALPLRTVAPHFADAVREHLKLMTPVATHRFAWSL
jgi:hypothetical protein